MCYLHQKDREKLQIKPCHILKSILYKSLREKHKSKRYKPKRYKKRILKRGEKTQNMERRTGLEPATISLEG